MTLDGVFSAAGRHSYKYEGKKSSAGARGENRWNCKNKWEQR